MGVSKNEGLYSRTQIVGPSLPRDTQQRSSHSGNSHVALASSIDHGSYQTMGSKKRSPRLAPSGLAYTRIEPLATPTWRPGVLTTGSITVVRSH